jgi:hypothetical protein
MRKHIVEKEKYLKLLKLFFILNIMDIVLTVFQIELIGIEIEANPIIRNIIETYGYTGSIIFKVLIGAALCIYLYFRYDEKKVTEDKKSYIILTILMSLCLGFYILLNVIHVINLTVYWGSYIYFN